MILGVEQYLKENYTGAIHDFSKALELYYVANDRCNALCEREHVFDYDYPDVPSFHMQTTGRCQLHIALYIIMHATSVH